MMKKRKVFISLPMAGFSDEYIRANIERAKTAYLALTGRNNMDVVEFVNTMDNPEPQVDIPENRKGAWYLGRSIIRLSQCDEVFFWLGWRKARGCVIEHEVCSMYNIPKLSVESDDDGR